MYKTGNPPVLNQNGYMTLISTDPAAGFEKYLAV